MMLLIFLRVKTEPFYHSRRYGGQVGGVRYRCPNRCRIQIGRGDRARCVPFRGLGHWDCCSRRRRVTDDGNVGALGSEDGGVDEEVDVAALLQLGEELAVDLDLDCFHALDSAFGIKPYPTRSCKLI